MIQSGNTAFRFNFVFGSGTSQFEYQILFDLPRGVEPGHGIHQHGEKRHDDNDGGFRLPVKPEPHHHDRRDADQRQRGNEIAHRQQPALEEGRTIDGDGHDKCRSAADGIADQH